MSPPSHKFTREQRATAINQLRELVENDLYEVSRSHREAIANHDLDEAKRFERIIGELQCAEALIDELLECAQSETRPTSTMETGLLCSPEHGHG